VTVGPAPIKTAPISTVPIGIAAVASYLPSARTGAAELADLTGIPEHILTGRFGVSGKHIAPASEQVSDLACAAGRRLLAEHSLDPRDVDAVVYFGSTWKDYPVWQAAPRIAYELGCVNAFALELDYTSCGSPVALRVARALMLSDPRIRTLLLVGASCESRLLDYRNERTRFMFGFGDGAVAALLVRDHPANQVLESSMLTDGSLSPHVKIPPGGRFLDVWDLDVMRERLGEVSLDNFLAVATSAVKHSGLALRDIAFLCPIHMKRSMHRAILTGLGLTEDQAIYLDDTGHMSGVDNLLALDRLARSGRLADGDVVLLLAAGVGYTWAATVLLWGSAPVGSASVGSAPVGRQ
jgi:3-oxoacyl-[acyl-carrier-protein] synthase III